jgi:hypothetical protein
LEIFLEFFVSKFKFLGTLQILKIHKNTVVYQNLELHAGIFKILKIQKLEKPKSGKLIS